MDPLKAKIDNFVKIRTIPPVLNALLMELDRSESSTGSIAKIISQDISLTARLLRVANSAFYKRQSEIKTVQQATGLLGTQAVKALALSVSLFDITGGLELTGLVNLRDFWRHNLEAAILSSRLARVVDGLNSEEAFACGLLHDLGIVFFIQMMPEEFSQVLRQVNENDHIEQIEKEIIGISHSEAGALVAEAWNLPGIFRESIAKHHQDQFDLESGQSRAVWQLVNLAHRYARSGPDINPKISIEQLEQRQAVTQALGLPADYVAGVLARLPDEVVAMASYLDIDIGDPWTLLTKANAELGELYDLYEKAIIDNNRMQIEMSRNVERRLTAEAMGTVLCSFAQLIGQSHSIICRHLKQIDLLVEPGADSEGKVEIARAIAAIRQAVSEIDSILGELNHSAENRSLLSKRSLHIGELHKIIKARLGRPAF